MCGFFFPLPLREWSLRPQQWRLLPGSHPSAFALGARFFLLLQWGRVLRCRRVLPDQYFSQTLHRVSTVAGPVHPTPPGCSRHCPEVALMPETLESNAVNVVLLAASHRWLSSAASAKTREEEKEAALPRCLTLSAFLSVLFFSHLYLLSIILLVIVFNIFLPLFSCLSSFSFVFLLLSFFPSAFITVNVVLIKVVVTFPCFYIYFLLSCCLQPLRSCSCDTFDQWRDSVEETQHHRVIQLVHVQWNHRRRWRELPANK